MKIAIENFGAIKRRIEIEPKPLTIFCGSNNTGKTYGLYVLNALMDSRFVASFDWARQHAKALLEQRELVVHWSSLLGPEPLKHAQNNIARDLKAGLPQFFVADKELTDDSRFDISLSLSEIESHLESNTSFYGTRPPDRKDSLPALLSLRNESANSTLVFSLNGKWTSITETEGALNLALMEFYCPIRKGRTFLLPAERSGLNLFFRELTDRRASILHHFISDKLNTSELLKDIVSRYPQPIHDYIDFMNAQNDIKRQTSEDFADRAAWLQKEVLRVKYKVDRYGQVSIAPLRSKTELGLHLGSSTAKTFFGLWSYLNHLAQPGDCLMIDEPELNLHPLNQRNIARLLAELVNRGIRVVVSTHSDYMVREWGNLVMLSEDFPQREEIAKQHGLNSAQWLAANKVHAYEFHAGGVVPMAVNAGSGIRTPLFDESIEQLNAAAQDIYFAVQAARPPEPEPTETKTGKARKGKA